MNGCLTPFLDAGRGVIVRFSTRKPFLRPTASPVLSTPGIVVDAATQSRSEHERVFSFRLYGAPFTQLLPY